MSVIARISVPAETFALGRALESHPGVRVRLESVVPTGSATVPYFWVRRTDAGAVETALGGSPFVEAVSVVDGTDDEALFRVTWTDRIDGVVGLVEDTAGVILEGGGQGEDWSFRLRFPDRTGLSAFYQSAIGEGIPVEVEEVYNPQGVDRDTPFGLTEGQHEALSVALERGYFDVPRRITLVELAEELGISDTAVSQRLRRGLRSFLSTTLVTSTLEDDD